MKICNSRLGLWVWRDIICIWTTMKTRTPDLLGMSYACANMVHCPGYADDLRQYTTLNSDHYNISVHLNNTTKKLHVEVWVLAHYAKLALNVIFTSRELTFMFSAISVYFWYTSWNWLGHFPVFEPADLIHKCTRLEWSFFLKPASNKRTSHKNFGIFDKSIRKLPFTREVMSQIL